MVVAAAHAQGMSEQSELTPCTIYYMIIDSHGSGEWGWRGGGHASIAAGLGHMKLKVTGLCSNQYYNNYTDYPLHTSL